MRIFALSVLIFLGFSAFPAPARANILTDNVITETVGDFLGKVTCWLVPCTGSGDEEFTRPNLHDAKTPHNIQFANDDWTPEDWVDETHTAQDIVSGFYDAGIITDQSPGMFGKPEIEVGQGFMSLSDRDKTRVIRFVDHVSGFTKREKGGAVVISHAASGDNIGIFTSEGLQLQ